MWGLPTGECTVHSVRNEGRVGRHVRCTTPTPHSSLLHKRGLVDQPDCGDYEEEDVEAKLEEPQAVEARQEREHVSEGGVRRMTWR